MIIELASIVERGKRVSFSLEDIDLDSDDAKLTGPVRFEGEMIRIEKTPRIRGVVTASVDALCTRCMAPTRRDASIEIDERFIEPDERGEIEIADLDEQIAIDGRIDLSEMLRDIVLLDLPEQIYCRDDCKGLCSQCGADLNLIDCTCNEKDVDPRWAVLKGIK